MSIHTFLEERGLSIKWGPCFRFAMSFQESDVWNQLASMSILMMSKTDMTSCHSNMLSYIKIEIYLTCLYGCGVATAVSGAKC
jgi:hypothetical protein